MDSPHLVRLMKLCRMLGGGDGLSAPQLRLKLKTSRRTVYRDLSILQKMGVPVRLVKHRYRIALGLPQCRKKIAEDQIRELHRLLRRA